MRLKKNVSLLGIKPEIIAILPTLTLVYNTFGQEFVITSGVEGKHKVGSFHYLGMAIDIRSRDFSSLQEVENFAQWIKNHLTVEYQIVVSKDCIHVEFNPPKGINV